jgi:hypothetical protein
MMDNFVQDISTKAYMNIFYIRLALSRYMIEENIKL